MSLSASFDNLRNLQEGKWESDHPFLKEDLPARSYFQKKKNIVLHEENFEILVLSMSRNDTG